MKRRNLRITSVLIVLLADATFIHIMMSFQAYLDHDNKEAQRTLSRDVILSLRTAVNYRPDRWTCLRMRSLGCAGRRRGCRGGKKKAKLEAKVQLPIPTITGRRSTSVNAADSDRRKTTRDVDDFKLSRCHAHLPLRRPRCLVDLRKIQDPVLAYVPHLRTKLQHCTYSMLLHSPNRTLAPGSTSRWILRRCCSD